MICMQTFTRNQTLRIGQNHICERSHAICERSNANFKQRIACDLPIANEVEMGLTVSLVKMEA